MATVAEELLNDFGSPGDDADEGYHGLMPAEKADGDGDDAMELDGQDAAQQGDSPDDRADLEDAEATKARVEKMKLGHVKDVRSVAGLMQTLEPVMEVSGPCPLPYPHASYRLVYIRLFEKQT